MNVQRTGLQGAVNDARRLVPGLPQLNDTQELHHYDDSLDFIITDQRERAGDFIRDDTTPRMRDFWNRLFSDAHYALFANIYFDRGS